MKSRSNAHYNPFNIFSNLIQTGLKPEDIFNVSFIHKMIFQLILGRLFYISFLQYLSHHYILAEEGSLPTNNGLIKRRRNICA